MINRNHQGSQRCMAYPQLVLWPLTRDLQADTAANEAAELFRQSGSGSSINETAFN